MIQKSGMVGVHPRLLLLLNGDNGSPLSGDHRRMKRSCNHGDHDGSRDGDRDGGDRGAHARAPSLQQGMAFQQ